ncbi:hypothetical protein [Chryseobacterium vrystaatense]|uniref:Uncharacterized protein n=1 Tax=Chryseobacterium vrystaatense TaxID=307480 RepID=A0A1M4ZHQ7_9FLAO|nr:hypothetical protein [Chryseobacterium vrystaatense]SHF17563.1 hypothetical protein SAMN02787073_1601 [Chryseobacterium vrystaatense]
MKKLELELKERLLIVEVPEHADMDCPFEILPNKGFKYLVFSQCKGNIISRFKMPDGDWKFICKGSELTEEVSKGLVKMTWIDDDAKLCKYKNYIISGSGSLSSALESFVSAIESQGWFWAKNDLTDSILAPDIDEWQEAESRTFNPEKTLIFKIL